MSDKKYVVPEGMLKAANKTWDHFGGIGVDNRIKVTLEAALRWLSENPILATFSEIKALFPKCSDAEIEWMITAIAKWQCRMFLLVSEPNPYDRLIDWAFKRATPDVDRIDIYSQAGTLLASKKVGRNSAEPEMPEEIKDLLLPDIESGFFKPEILNERLHEAYRRGQKAK